MTTANEPNTCVESITLMDELDKRVAVVTVRVGEVEIRGIAVWRSKNGKLSVFFPSYKLGSVWADAISVPDELRSEIEADVIEAYKNAKAASKKDQETHSNQDAAVKLGRAPRVQFPFKKLRL
jgi:hypothetical protein